MWSSLLVLALLTTINPVRIGLVILVLSRPRPMQNLLAYWTGAVIISLLSLLIPLFAIHAYPASASFAESFADPAANPNAQRTAIGIGVLLLAVAVLMAVRSLVKAQSSEGRHSVQGPARNSNTATRVHDSTAPPVITRLLEPQQDVATEGDSATRRMLRRIRTAWQNGNPWIAFLIGVLVVPPLDGVLFGLAIIVTSGTSIGLQVVAVIVFIVGVLAVEEAILVSNLVAPAKTASALQRLHDLARTHHQKFVAGILAVVGLSLILRGLGGL